MREAAPAKVNLFLHVVGRRGDGYHLLDSLAVFPGAADILTAEAADGLELTVAGPHGTGLAADGDNLVIRAARALADHADVPARARLVLDACDEEWADRVGAERYRVFRDVLAEVALG